MATGVASWSQTAATNASSDSAQNWAEGMAPSLVNDSARGGMASVAKYRDDTAGSLTTGGTSTAYTVTTNQAFASLTALDGMELAVKFNATNGAAPTLAVDGLTAKAINVSHATAVGTGVILANSVWGLTYNNSNNCFLLRNIPAQIQDGTVATASIAANAVTYAKIQSVAASSLIGNATGSGATPTAISLGSGLAFVGSALTPTISAPLVPNYISGLTLSTAGSSATMSIAAGVANDSTNATLMSLAAFSKTTSSWALGTGNGGLDTGAIATSTWYHFYVIQRTDTNVVDVLFSTSASAPTMPTNYTLKRRIGSGLTNGSSQWVKFFQNGDEFLWDVPVLDLDRSNLSTAAVTETLPSIPTGVIVNAITNILIQNAAAGVSVLLSPLSVTDAAPSATAAPGATLRTIVGNTACMQGNFNIRTNTSAQIRSRADASSTSLRIFSLGWVDLRGKA